MVATAAARSPAMLMMEASGVSSGDITEGGASGRGAADGGNGIGEGTSGGVVVEWTQQ